MTLLPTKTLKTAAHRLDSLQNRAWLPPALLLLALSSVFLFGGERGHFYQETSHNLISSERLAIANNLSREHHFMMFIGQSLDADGEPTYKPYNRFPIGGYALIKLAILPFGDNLTAKIYAARMLMLVFFAAAACLAYLSLRRLSFNGWIALTATLLAFSSPYFLYYNDAIIPDISMDLFAVLLVFHSMVIFEQEKRFLQLLVKTCVALLLGWHVYALLMPFIIFGLTREFLKARPDAPVPAHTAHQLKHVALSLARSRYLTLGVVALLFGISSLAFYFTNEYMALSRESSLTETPSFQSMINRIGVGSYFKASQIRAEYLSWTAFAERQFYRIGMMTLPYAFSPSFVEQRFDALPRIFVILGIAVSAVSLIGLRSVGRHKILLASLALSGFCWALPMRYNVAYPWHSHEVIFYIGVALTFFSLAMLYLRSLSSERLVAALSAAALLVFAFSALRMSQLNGSNQTPEFHEAAISDIKLIRNMTDAGDVIRTSDMPEIFQQLTIFDYYLSGRIMMHGYEAIRRARPPDFIIRSEYIDGLASLTPQNRVLFLYEWDAHRKHMDEMIAQAGAPIIRSDFDVYLSGNTLMYVKDACSNHTADTNVPFFLAVYPRDESSLPADRIEHGFDNLDFHFQYRGIRFRERCIVMTRLPDYDIARIYTGQYIQQADGSTQHTWEGDVRLTEAAR